VSVSKASAVLLVLFLAAAAFALFGGVPLDWSSLGDVGSASHRIFYELRLPRLAFVFFAGAALASVGAVYQILFHNPLAEPYLLGISSAATLGIAVGETFWGIAAQTLASQGIGLVSASVVTAAILGISLVQRGTGTERVALFGLGVNFVLSAVLFLLLSYQAQTVGGGSLRWLFGQVPWLSAVEAIRFAVFACVGLAALLLASRSLDALAFGDGVARTLGFSAPRARLFYLGVTSVLMAWLVSFTGSIGFVGLVVPHLARLLFRPSTSRALLALSIPMGGAFLLLADGISRSLLPPMEFPVGVVTTVLGGPLFLFLLWKR
jgi:iron complex transport system permease protein